MKIALVLSLTRGAQGVEVVGVGPAHLPAEILEGVIELVDRAAVELGRGDEFVAGLHQRVEDDRLRGVAGGDGERRRRALERGDALFQRRGRRVGDAGVDVAERLQAEQRGGVVDVVEDEGGRLVDRRDPRAGGRVGPGARRGSTGWKSRVRRRRSWRLLRGRHGGKFGRRGEALTPPRATRQPAAAEGRPTEAGATGRLLQ